MNKQNVNTTAKIARYRALLHFDINLKPNILNI